MTDRFRAVLSDPEARRYAQRVAPVIVARAHARARARIEEMDRASRLSSSPPRQPGWFARLFFRAA